MNKEDRIKELAKDMGIGFQLSGTTRFGPVAAELVEMGYQRIKKDGIVISKEEYEELKQAKTLLESREETIKYLEDANIRYAEALELKVNKKERKETAEKITKRLKSIIKKALKSNYKAIEKREEKHPYLLEDELFEVRCKGKIDALQGMDYEIDELAKQFGVEIKE